MPTQRLQTSRCEYETATYYCPMCSAQIRVLADEYADHPCPKCRWSVSAETEAHANLADTVKCYVQETLASGKNLDITRFMRDNRYSFEYYDEIETLIEREVDRSL